MSLFSSSEQTNDWRENRVQDRQFLVRALNYLIFRLETRSSLQSQLRPAPVTTLGIPLNGIAGPHTDPLRQWPILTLLLGKSSLRSE
jgi:hypothetical protein